jgi:hypothetical protein
MYCLPDVVNIRVKEAEAKVAASLRKVSFLFPADCGVAG